MADEQNESFGLIRSCQYDFDGRLENRYRCRGIGKTIDSLYAWLNTVSLIDPNDDWPWFYFGLSSEDEKTLHANFVVDDDDPLIWVRQPYIDQMATNNAFYNHEIDLANILKKEITDEIDRSILEMTKTNATD